jgi:hypothetical protein
VILDTESCPPDNEPVCAERVLELSEEEKAARFDELQLKLVPLWKSIARVNQDPQTIVVVPSLTVDTLGLPGAMLQAYEERFLFLLLLRQPRARMIYVTSQAILPSIVDYYRLAPGRDPSHARQRLVSSRRSTARTVADREAPRLTAPAGADPKLDRRSRSRPPGAPERHRFERDLALELGSRCTG